jgi:chemotaxis protein histidine kinase CheA
MATVRITGVQAIGHIEFDMPDGEGGVKLFRGRNGAGKTTAIACLQALLGRKVSLQPSDDAPSGQIEGLGVSKTIASRQASKGSVVAPNLEGRLDFSDLVDPPVKDAKARNRVRINALVGLTARGVSCEDFHELFGGRDYFEEVVPVAQLRGISDPLEMADIIKKAAEAEARHSEALAEDSEARWRVKIEEAKAAKAGAEPPSVKSLADAFAAAKNRLERLRQTQRDAERIAAANVEVTQKLSAHAASRPAVTVEDAHSRVKGLSEAVASLEQKLATARESLAAARREFEQVMAWEERLTELQSMLQAGPELTPSEADMAAAEAAEQAAMHDLEHAEQAKRQYEAAVEAEQLGRAVVDARASAAHLRNIAKSTSEIVAKFLPEGCALQVIDGQLCAMHDIRGDWVPMDELSEGERWKVGLEIAIAAVGPGGVIPVRQEAWQSLDKDAAKYVASRCSEAKVWLVSGAVGDGELYVEDFQP